MPRDISYQKERGERQENRILEALAVQPMTTSQLSTALHLSVPRVNTYIPRLRAASKVYTFDFVVSGSFHVPVHALGNKPDASRVRVKDIPKPPRVEAQTIRVRDFLKTAHSAEQVALHLGVTVSRARVYIRKLRKLGEVYIKEWLNMHGQGDLTPFYELGNRPDAPKPKRTRADRYRKEQADAEKYERVLAKRRARYHVAKAKSRQNTWAGALGIG